MNGNNFNKDYNTSVTKTTTYKCDYCGLEAFGAKTEREARINWNKMVTEGEE